MADEIEPPAIVRAIDNAAEFIHKARAIDGNLLTDLDCVAAGVKLRGEMLLKAKEAAGHGNWLKALRKHWPGLSRRTASRYIAQANGPTLAHLKKVTHQQLEGDGEDDEDDPAEEVKPPLSEKRRKILIRIISYTNLSLSKKLLSGEKVMTDKELEDACPPHCDKCDRGNFPTFGPCFMCEDARKKKQLELFQETQEEGEEPPDELAELAAQMTKTATLATKLINSGQSRLLQAFTWAGIVEYDNDGKAKFLPLAGAPRIVNLIRSGKEITEQLVKTEYSKGCGTWMPEKIKYWKSKKKGK